MRPLLAVAAVGLLAPVAAADDPKPKKPEPTLRVGDQAPVLNPDKWLQGAGPAAFEPGQVYVVEFWATWCGPCIAMMPHLADLQDEYKAKGVTVVGFSSTAQDKRDAAEKFVARRGPKLGYAFGWGDSDAVHKAWMGAAGLEGIPRSFVVGKDGRLAYIGHPMYLDVVLPKVLAGADAEAVAAEVAAAVEDWVKARHAMTAADPADGLKVYDAIRPEVANIPYLTGQRLGLMVRAKRFAEARAFAEGMVAKAGKRGDTGALAAVATSLATAKDQPELTKLALKAADANLLIAGDESLPALMTAQAAYAAAGETDKVKGFAEKAVTAAEKLVRGDKNWQDQLLLASVYKAAGKADKAKAAAQKALDYAPPADKQYVGQQAEQYGVEVKSGDDK